MMRECLAVQQGHMVELTCEVLHALGIQSGEGA
jgi:hypothetical protein